MADALNTLLQFAPYTGSGPGFTGLALNDTDNAAAVVMQAGTADAITHIGFRHTSTTGTSPTYKCSVQGVNVSGQPDGTIKGGGTPASATFSPSSLGWAANTWNWVALDNPYTPTRGEFISLVVTYDSGVVSGANFSNIAYFISEPTLALAYPIDFQAAWTKRSGQSVLAYKTAAGIGGFVLQSNTQLNYQSGSSPNEYGVKFTLPSGWATTCKIAGIRLLLTLPAASTVVVSLYDGGGASDTTVLNTVTIDGDYSGSGNRQHELRFADATLATLTFGNTYRIGIRAGSAVNTTIYYADVAASTDFQSWPMGDNACWTSRAGGNWTDLATRRPFGALILDDITGGGGGSSNTGILLGGLGMTGIGAF
jgi:hypothetical protein